MRQSAASRCIFPPRLRSSGYPRQASCPYYYVGNKKENGNCECEREREKERKSAREREREKEGEHTP